MPIAVVSIIVQLKPVSLSCAALLLWLDCKSECKIGSDDSDCGSFVEVVFGSLSLFGVCILSKYPDKIPW